MKTPVFELHILPCIRATDREHMSFKFDLWNYEQLVANAELFADRVAVDMPPADSGGPWPHEWTALFRRWMATGFKRLELGTAQYTWNQSATATTLRAAGTFPAPGYQGWLQLESEDDARRNYVLYFEPPDERVAGAGEAFNVRDRYKPTDGRMVFVRDLAGLTQVH